MSGEHYQPFLMVETLSEVGNSEYDITSVIAYISEERQRVYVMARGREP